METLKKFRSKQILGKGRSVIDDSRAHEPNGRLESGVVIRCELCETSAVSAVTLLPPSGLRKVAEIAKELPDPPKRTA